VDARWRSTRALPAELWPWRRQASSLRSIKGSKHQTFRDLVSPVDAGFELLVEITPRVLVLPLRVRVRDAEITVCEPELHVAGPRSVPVGPVAGMGTLARIKVVPAVPEFT
jgi:hypothetical protein